MSHRILVPLAITGSIGLAAAFMPAVAEAASAGHGTTAPSTAAHFTAAQSAAALSASTAVDATSGTRKVSAPATKSHYFRQAPRVGSNATNPNPNLGVSMYGGDEGVFTITVYADITGYTTKTSGGLSATVSWGDGTSTSYTNVSTSPAFKHQYAELGTYNVTVTVSDGEGDGATDTWNGLQTIGSDYTPYNPTRILDTRTGIGSAATPLAAHGTVKLQVGGTSTPAAIPSDITAVVLNVTATGGTANGFLTVYGDDDIGGTPVALPATSNVNYVAGQNVPNLVIVPVGLNGVVDFYNGATKGDVGVVADIEGYFTETNTNEYFSVKPTRILDTRKGTGTGTVKQIPANGNLTLTVAGAGKGVIPAKGATAIAMNLTAVDATRNGVITAYPAGETTPTVSNLNYSAGQTRANMAIVPVGTNGQIVLHNDSSGPVDLIADANGYFTPAPATGGSAYNPFAAPIREFDTRPGSQPTGTAVPVAPGYDAAATSVVYNATVTGPTGAGYLELYPYNPKTPNTVPSASNLNYAAGQTVPNLAIVQIGTVPDTAFNPPVYEIGVYLGGHGSAQVILDVFGFFDNH